jgi:Dyp-type peroxidase family
MRPLDGWPSCESGKEVNAVTERLDLDDIQGLVVRGYGSLPHAAFALMHVADAARARSVLNGWTALVTPASVSPADLAVQLAISSGGIDALCPHALLATGFPEHFLSGMVTSHRSRLLGDVGDDDPLRWQWGGPASDQVHVLLMLYTSDRAALDGRLQEMADEGAAHGLRLLARLGTDELSDREPFGFRDGVSQPTLQGLPRAARSRDVVAAGEFVLGYVNEYGQRAERPVLAHDADPRDQLPRAPDDTRLADLGRNGSYLVLRQLSQDVDGFWDYVERQSGTDPAGRAWLAAKLVGRWPGGAPLVLSPDRDDPALGAANDFGYHALDRSGHACPIGAHVRRANPRDSLEPAPGTEQSREVNRRHRLLRRGRNWSRPADGSRPAEQGIHFICLNANLGRQYEFVQHSWINDPSFNGLHEAADPLVGPRYRGGTTFAIQAPPLRARLRELPHFVQVRGGGYFLLPGIRALRYLTSEPSAPQEGPPS